MDKAELRRQYRLRLSALESSDRAGKSAAMSVFLLSLPEYRAADTVFCFAGTKTEPNTLPFIRRALSDGKRVCLPLIIAKGRMQARLIADPAELSAGSFGIPEPPPTAPVAPPEEIDFAVLPCVAMARDGVRLGHGGGYYDRFLAGCGASLAALCFEAALCDALPREPHDIPVPLIITEKRIYRVG